MSKLQDVFLILRSLRMIAESGIKLHQSDCRLIWDNSCLKTLAQDLLRLEKTISRVNNKQNEDLLKCFSDNMDRLSTVIQGINKYNYETFVTPTYKESTDGVSIDEVNNKNTSALSDFSTNQKEISLKNNYDIKLTPADRELLKKLDLEHERKMNYNSGNIGIKTEANTLLEKEETNLLQMDKIREPRQLNSIKSIPNPKATTLSPESKQRTVPASRVGRMVSFGSLAAGLGVGTIAEFARRTFGFGSNKNEVLFMTEANLNRIVDTLCKVRGAALKLGQILSIQDDSVIQPELARALERVRKSADYMPDWQVDQMLSSELGPDWQSNITTFERKPFAAASIGQVHMGTMKNGQQVAIKIQYPGVAQGINSDIDNLVGIMNLWNIFPRGMFLENLMAVAKRELAWEVDYQREAECTKKFRELLAPYSEYYVPYVVDELSTKRIFTSELLTGIPIDNCFDLSDDHKHFIGYNIIRLCLLEILKFRYMQTDPNWANFLYDPNKRQIILLDFGASREYAPEFMSKYIKILKAAYDSDRETIEKLSGEIGFFTGYESKVMVEAHVDAVMILGEIFQCDTAYDFGNQNMTQRIQNLVPTMLTHRLCPPPEEIYSLHRKLSGVFLLCAKLKVPLSCRQMFLSLYNEYTKEQEMV